MRSWGPRASSRPVSGGCVPAALGANRHQAGQPPSSTPHASCGSSGSNTGVTRRSSRSGSSSSSGINATGDLSAARARWLPDQPTFVCPPITAEGSLDPSDEAWAERGIFLSYGKAHLSYHDVEALLQLASLDISPAEFRAATAVVWAYRYRPDDSTDTTAKESASAAAGPSSQQACTSGGGNAVGSCWERSSVGDGGGGGQGAGGAPEIELVGFASADVAPAPGPPPSAAMAVAAEAGDGAAGGASAGSGGGGRSRRRRRADAATIAEPGRQGLAVGIPQRNVSTDGGGGGGAGTATIWYLAVHPSFRRQGLGRALLERLVSGLYDSRSGAPPPLVVSLRATSRSAAFYDRLGLRRDPAAPLVRNAGGSGSGSG